MSVEVSRRRFLQIAIGGAVALSVPLSSVLDRTAARPGGVARLPARVQVGLTTGGEPVNPDYYSHISRWVSPDVESLTVPYQIITTGSFHADGIVLEVDGTELASVPFDRPKFVCGGDTLIVEMAVV